MRSRGSLDLAAGSRQREASLIVSDHAGCLQREVEPPLIV